MLPVFGILPVPQKKKNFEIFEAVTNRYCIVPGGKYAIHVAGICVTAVISRVLHHIENQIPSIHIPTLQSPIVTI